MSNNTNPLSGIYDDFMTILSSIKIKYSYEVNKYETLESRQNGDEYIAAYEKRDNFFSYDDYNKEEYNKAIDNDFSNSIYKQVSDSNNISFVPENGTNSSGIKYRDKLLELRRKRILNDYNELNDYYRLYNGLPPLNEYKYNFHYVPEDIAKTYGMIPDDGDENIPIHNIRKYFNNKSDGKGDYFISILEGLGFLDKLAKENPKDEYLKYIGSNRISIYKLRTAKNFQILYIDKNNINSSLYEEFMRIYEQSRDYFVSTIYNTKLSDFIKYYDNFIGLCIMVMTIQHTITRQLSLGIKREFYNNQALKILYEAYSIPYDMNIDDITQRNIAQSLNILIQNKSTNKVLFDICKLLGFEDINIYKHYLVKDRIFDRFGLPVIAYTDKFNDLTGEKESVYDFEKMYNLYFQKVDLKDSDIITTFNNKINTLSYDEVVSNDPFWWEDNNLFKEIWESEYNYIETKYLSLSISYKMTEIIYENILLIKMLIDKNEPISSITFSIPKIMDDNTEINLFHAIILLCCLTSKKHHLGGEIITIPSQVLSVLDYLRNEDINSNSICDTFSFNFDSLKTKSIYEEYVEYINKNNLEIEYVYIKCNEDIQFNKNNEYYILDPITNRFKYDNNKINNMDYYIKKISSPKYSIDQFKKDVLNNRIKSDCKILCMTDVLSNILSKEDNEKLNKYLSILSLPLNESNNKDKIKALNDMYDSIKGLGDFLSYRISKTSDKNEYYVLKQLYRTLYYSKENKEIFSIVTEDDECLLYENPDIDDYYSKYNGDYFFLSSPDSYVKTKNGIVYERNITPKYVNMLVESGLYEEISDGVYQERDYTDDYPWIYYIIPQTVCGYKSDGTSMNRLESIKEYNEIKNSIYMKKIKKSRKRVAKTFFEYLYWINPKLYSSIFTIDIENQYDEYLEENNLSKYDYTMKDFMIDVNLGLCDIRYDTLIDETNDSNVNDDRLYYYIDHIIFKMENVIKNLKFIYKLNDTSSPVEDLLIKLIRFFKSYTTELLNLDILYICNLKQENIIKLIDHIQLIKKTIEPLDNLKMRYSDNISILKKELNPYDKVLLNDNYMYRTVLHWYDKRFHDKYGNVYISNPYGFDVYNSSNNIFYIIIHYYNKFGYGWFQNNEMINFTETLYLPILDNLPLIPNLNYFIKINNEYVNIGTITEFEKDKKYYMLFDETTINLLKSNNLLSTTIHDNISYITKNMDLKDREKSYDLIKSIEKELRTSDNNKFQDKIIKVWNE